MVRSKILRFILAAVLLYFDFVFVLDKAYSVFQTMTINTGIDVKTLVLPALVLHCKVGKIDKT